jgi:hypothetical protein
MKIIKRNFLSRYVILKDDTPLFPYLFIYLLHFMIYVSDVSNFARTGSRLTPLRIFLYAAYWLMSVITVCGFQGIDYQTKEECILTTILVIFGMKLMYWKRSALENNLVA